MGNIKEGLLLLPAGPLQSLAQKTKHKLMITMKSDFLRFILNKIIRGIYKNYATA